ncbi:MAG TPA: 50S ribosomal protein L6, partial [Bacteroidia bacterium]|nr:50S ribosomal protein L6 [Bacteroidia bacterium]
MSRIGKLPITLPAKVEIKVADGTVQVKGPKGELTQKLNDGITVKIDGTTLTVER